MRQTTYKYRAQRVLVLSVLCQQVDAIWKKTERAITEGQLEKASGLCQQGKKLTTKRLKVLRIADMDGWDTALAYLSDELASGSEDEKRLRKARRIAQTNRESANKRGATFGNEKGRRTARTSYDDHDGWRGRKAGDRDILGILIPSPHVTKWSRV